MLKTIVIVVLLIAVLALGFLCLGFYSMLRDLNAMLPFLSSKERPTTVWKTTTTTKKTPCPVPFPECGPDGCRKCGGNGFTEEEH